MSQVNHSDAIRGLRGISVIGILAHHYFPRDYFSYNLGKIFTYLIIAIAGYFFTQLFLANRADLDAPSLRKRAASAAALVWLQFIRTWPLIAVVIVLYIGLGIIDGGELTTQVFHTWWMYLVGLGNVPKFVWGADAFPSHFWAVGAQDQAFVILAAIMVFAGYSRFAGVLPWIIGIGIAFRTVSCLFLMPDYPAWALETPLSVIDVIALAIWTRFGIERPELRGILGRHLLTSALILFLVWAVLPNTNTAFYGLVPVMVTAFAMWLLLSVSDEKRAGNWQKSLLCAPALVFMGRIALCVFFINPLVGAALNLAWLPLFHQHLPWWGLAFLGTAVSLPLAWLLHIGVERPLLRKRSRKRVRRPIKSLAGEVC